MKNKGTIQHLLINLTRLKIYGEGKWKVKKHGTDEKQLVWHQLHLVVKINTHEGIAAEFSASNITDGEVLPNLLKQIR